jgi:hypothetical protein
VDRCREKRRLTDMGGRYQPRRSESFINLILSCLLKVTDRYALAKEFELRKFEMQVMKMTDLYQVQEIAIRLFSQTIAQRRVYEQLLRDTNQLPPAG